MVSLKSKCVCILDAFLPYDMNILHVWLCVGSTLIFHSLMFSSFCTQKQQQQQLVLINWEITILTPAGCSKLMFQILLQGGLMLSRTSAPKRTGAQRKSTVKKNKTSFFPSGLVLHNLASPCCNDMYFPYSLTAERTTLTHDHFSAAVFALSRAVWSPKTWDDFSQHTDHLESQELS